MSGGRRIGSRKVKSSIITSSSSNRKQQQQQQEPKSGGQQAPSEIEHNWCVPCCALLSDVTKELWGIDSDSGNGSSGSTSRLNGNGSIKEPKAFSEKQSSPSSPPPPPPSSSPLPLLPSKNNATATTANKVTSFGQMMRNYHLEQLYKAAGGTTTINKKKKKKKKKKTRTTPTMTAAAAVVAATATSSSTEEATAAISVAVADETNSVVDSSSAGAGLIPQAVAAATATESTATDLNTLSAANQVTTATNNNNSSSSSSSSSSDCSRTPIDAYVNRFWEAEEKKRQQQQEEQDITNDSNTYTSAPLPEKKDLQAFVDYLNQHYSSPDLSALSSSGGEDGGDYDNNNKSKGSSNDNKKNTNNKKKNTANNNNNNNNNNNRLSITIQELEAACQVIGCDNCKTSVLNALHHQEFSTQPLFLNPLVFESHPSNVIHNSNNNYNHNGLALPVHNQKISTTNQYDTTTITTDFDYVALEEGTSSISINNNKNNKSNIAAFFQPHVGSATPSTSSSSNNGVGVGGGVNKKTTNKDRIIQPQLEWQFVSAASAAAAVASSSSLSNTTNLDNKCNQQAMNDVVITLQDLEHMSKYLMLPLGMRPDDFVGVCTELSKEELQTVGHDTTECTRAFDDDIEDMFEREIPRMSNEFDEVCRKEAGDDNLAGVSTSPVYTDLDVKLHKAMEQIVLKTILDKTLMLSETNAMSSFVFPSSPAWYSASAFLGDAAADAILREIECMSAYEKDLSELANTQGLIPHLPVSRAHRTSFASMIRTRLRILQELAQAAQRALGETEDAWMVDCSTYYHADDNGTSSGANSIEKTTPVRVGLSGIVISTRNKWYAEQEFCRKLDKKRKNQPEQQEIDAKKLIRSIDTRTLELLKGLLDLAKRVERGRFDEVKEENNFRVIRALNLLTTRVGTDVIAPLTENDAKRPSGSFLISDENILGQCQALWANIKDHKEQQEKRAFLNEEGPSIEEQEEQKRTVALMIKESLAVLRKLRKCVTDSHFSTVPLMPFELVSKLGNPFVGQTNYNYEAPDMVVSSYAGLVSMFHMASNRRHCLGEGKQQRLLSLILGLFFRKLSEKCSEWHAELAEQELLTAMSSNDSGLHGMNGSLKGSTATGGSGDPSGKASKKTKKKKSKKTTVAEATGLEAMVAETADETKNENSDSNSVTQTDEKDSVHKTSAQANLSIESDHKKTNGHQAVPAVGVPEKTSEEWQVQETKPKAQQTLGYKVAVASAINTKANEADTDTKEPKSCPKGKMPLSSKATAMTDQKVLSMYRNVDKRMGVEDQSGTVQSAESYLVGRLNLLLSESQNPKTGKHRTAPVIFL